VDDLIGGSDDTYTNQKIFCGTDADDVASLTVLAARLGEVERRAIMLASLLMGIHYTKLRFYQRMSSSGRMCESAEVRSDRTTYRYIADVRTVIINFGLTGVTV
jgi:hypothetical protein